MLEKLIQQKEERVADLETLRTRRDQAKAECILRFPPVNSTDEYLHGSAQLNFVVDSWPSGRIWRTTGEQYRRDNREVGENRSIPLSAYCDGRHSQPSPNQ
jgi:hypothetical protein